MSIVCSGTRIEVINSFSNPVTSRKLPKGWRWVKLEEVCEIVSGTTPKSAVSQYWNGEIVWITPTDLGKLADRYVTDSDRRISKAGYESCNLTMVPVGSVVLSSRAPIGHLGIAAVPLCTNQGCKTFVPGIEVDSEFLYHALKSSVWELQQMGSGATFAEVSKTQLEGFDIPIPPLPEQKRIAAILNEQMAAVERARKAAEEQALAAELYPVALVRESLEKHRPRRMALGECLQEVRTGVGPDWAKYPVLGATRQGLAPAKDPVGKTPERYKPVTCGTVFYNPMRILLGSIAMVDDSDTPGITSPDYVVVRGKDGVLDSRWFYYWFRSAFGAHLIESLSRGAVRERILFNRLAEGTIEIPPIAAQKEASAKMRDVAASTKTIAEQLDAINTLPTALLRRAFAGEV